MSATLQDIQVRVLSNGLRVLVREDHTTPVVALNFWVRVGSNNETGELQGWSHGIEHMLFKGTGKRPAGAIANEIKNAGGELNAGTGYETTNYYIVVPKEEMATALDIHADVLMNSTFDPGELENERQVLIEENQMYRDRPSGYGITWEELFRLGFTTHRYRDPIGGPDLNLKDTPRDAILGHLRRYYVPDNVIYVIVGDGLRRRSGTSRPRPSPTTCRRLSPSRTSSGSRNSRGMYRGSTARSGFIFRPSSPGRTTMSTCSLIFWAWAGRAGSTRKCASGWDSSPRSAF
jgi:hypothetical protein